MSDGQGPIETEAVADERRAVPWFWIIVVLGFAAAAGMALSTSRPALVEEVLVYRILVRVDPLIPNDEERAKAKAERIREELSKPGAGFSAVALREDETLNARSTDPGGIGWARRGTLSDPALELLLFSLDIDEVSDIYKDDEGYSIFTVTERREVPAR